MIGIDLLKKKAKIDFYHLTQEEFQRNDKTQLVIKGIKQYFRIKKTSSGIILVGPNSNSKLQKINTESKTTKDNRKTKIAFKRNQQISLQVQTNQQDSQIQRNQEETEDQNEEDCIILKTTTRQLPSITSSNLLRPMTLLFSQQVEKN